MTMPKPGSEDGVGGSWPRTITNQCGSGLPVLNLELGLTVLTFGLWALELEFLTGSYFYWWLDLIELFYGVMQVTNRDKHQLLLSQVLEVLSCYACAWTD